MSPTSIDKKSNVKSDCLHAKYGLEKAEIQKVSTNIKQVDKIEKLQESKNKKLEEISNMLGDEIKKFLDKEKNDTDIKKVNIFYNKFSIFV